MTRRLGLVLPILLIVGWEVAAIIVNNPFFLPKLETVIPVLISPFSDILGTGSLVQNALISIERVALGFALAAAVAIPLGIGMGRFAVLNDFFDVTIELLRPVPPLPGCRLRWHGSKSGLSLSCSSSLSARYFPSCSTR